MGSMPTYFRECAEIIGISAIYPSTMTDDAREERCHRVPLSRLPSETELLPENRSVRRDIEPAPRDFPQHSQDTIDLAPGFGWCYLPKSAGSS